MWMTRRRQKWILFSLGCVLTVLFILHTVDHAYRLYLHGTRVHITISCCGDRKHEAAVLIKSAVMLTRTKLVFHIFTENSSREYFTNQIGRLKESTRTDFSYKFYDMQFPSSSSTQWRNLFAPCASQRLFMHSILTDINFVLYVDTDVIFLSPPEDTWSLLTRFNSTQFAAMTPEQIEDGRCWYDTYNDTLKYGSKGLNSGVLLMNLAYLRLHPWNDELVDFLERFKNQVRLGDQDLLNIYFHFHPERLYLAPCEYNYRSDYCMDKLTCKRPAKILHGNRQISKYPNDNPFKAVYSAIREIWDTNMLPYKVCKNVNNPLKDKCGQSSHIFVEEIFKRFLPDVKYKHVNGRCYAKRYPRRFSKSVYLYKRLRP